MRKIEGEGERGNGRYYPWKWNIIARFCLNEIRKDKSAHFFIKTLFVIHIFTEIQADKRHSIEFYLFLQNICIPDYWFWILNGIYFLIDAISLGFENIKSWHRFPHFFFFTNKKYFIFLRIFILQSWMLNWQTCGTKCHKMIFNKPEAKPVCGGIRIPKVPSMKLVLSWKSMCIIHTRRNKC